jgi:predicted choloylglycine hydrolase
MSTVAGVAPQVASKPIEDGVSKYNVPTRVWNQLKQTAQDRPVVMYVTAVFFATLGLTMLGLGLWVPIAVVSSKVLIGMGAGALFISLPFSAALVKELIHIPRATFLHWRAKHVRQTPCYTFKDQQVTNGKTFHKGKEAVVQMSGSHYEMGKAHAKMHAGGIDIFWKKYMTYGIPMLLMSPRAEYTHNQRAKETVIPDEYRLEMQGMVDGYNEWRAEEDKRLGLLWSAPKLTVEHILGWHYLIDRYKDTGKVREYLGCSVLCVRGEDGKMRIGRNFDFPSMEILGGLNCIQVRKPNTGKHYATVVLAVTGTIGVASGMNEHGLCVTVNEVGVCYKQRKTPYTILTRHILETCKTVQDAEEYVKKNHPSSSFTMTVADPNTAKAFQFYPEKGKNESGYTTREPNKEGMMVVTNHFFDAKGEIIKESLRAQTSLIRFQEMSKFKRPAKDDELLDKVAEQMKAKRVQTYLTVHSVAMDPSKREFLVEMSNSGLGHRPSVRINWNELVS